MRLLYLSPVPWVSFAQRPHRLVEWFHARTGGEVLWIDPYPTRLPLLTDYLRMGVAAKPQCDLTPDWLKVFKPRALPVEPLVGSGYLNRLLWGELFVAIDKFVAQEDCKVGVGKPSELALQVLKRTAECFSFYDAMDDFPAFYSGLSRRAMAGREYHLAALVDRIMVSSTALRTRFSDHDYKSTLISNACGIASLPPIKSLSRPKGQVVLGYLGTIGAWFDWHLVMELAIQNPSALVRVIGPVHSSPPGKLPGNIQLMPPCGHAAGIRAMQEFTVGLVPFKKTDLTASVDPIKYYEYRALGIPVLTTTFGEMAQRNEAPGVFFMDQSIDLQRIVRIAADYEYELDDIRAFRDANSWEVRFDASDILS